MIVTVDDLIATAKKDSKVSGWPWGESYYKQVVCRFTPAKKNQGRATFQIDYKKASREDVEKYLQNLFTPQA